MSEGLLTKGTELALRGGLTEDDPRHDELAGVLAKRALDDVESGIPSPAGNTYFDEAKERSLDLELVFSLVELVVYRVIESSSPMSSQELLGKVKSEYDFLPEHEVKQYFFGYMLDKTVRQRADGTLEFVS